MNRSRRALLWCLTLFLALVACSTREGSRAATTSGAAVPYRFAAVGTRVWQASNPAQRFSVRLDASDVTISAERASWVWSMRLLRVARGDFVGAALRSAPRLDGDRLLLAHGTNVVEWYEHTSAGLEQGFDLVQRPDGDGPLTLELATAGLAAALRPDGSAVELRDESGRPVLWYGELRVVDADGRPVPAHLGVVRDHITLSVDDERARYPLVVDPLVWGVQQQKIVASDSVLGDDFGQGVAVSGDTALVGATGSLSGGGAAYVFVRTATTWSLQQKLSAFDGASSDSFGRSLAIDGDTAVVSAYGKATYTGAAYVFVRSGTTWSLQQKLLALDATVFDQFARSVALSGDTLVVGAPGRASHTGAAYVFVRSGSTWTQQAVLTPSDATADEDFGVSVSLSSDTALVGASQNSSSRGAAYVFLRSGTTWTQQQKLVAADAAAGDLFGVSVAVSGDTGLVGAYTNSGGRGAAYAFVRSAGVWSQQQKLTPSDAVANDNFGTSVAMVGDVALVGASGKASNTGAAYVWVRTGSTWTEQRKLVALDAASSDYFAQDVALTSTIALCGATLANGSKGAAYVFVQAHALGDPCTTPTDCVSGFCIDGVCCDTACAGACQACTAAKKGAGVDGTCAAIADGHDPDVECPSSTCLGATLENGHTCNGAGACRATTTTACAPYVCDAAGKACLSTCTTDASCAAADYCSGTSCVAKKALGAACSGVRECASGFCVDGVCCNRACTATCEACAAAKIGSGGSDGTCANVGDGLPHAACPPSTCTSGTMTAHVCDGAGACKVATSACGVLGCDASGTACVKKCTVDGDCGLAGYCPPTGECAPRKDKGIACGAGDECKVGTFCVDGVCCDKPCDGQCEACNEGATPGTCAPVDGKPRGKRAACADDGKGCAGACDAKVSSIACVYPDATVACGSKCVGSKIALCNGKGACSDPAPCLESLTCGADGKCRDRCAEDADCVAGYGCTAGKCTPKATKCSDDRTASIDSAGKATTCQPILCDVPSGICGAVCNSQSDCVAGTSCNSSKQCVRDDAQTTDAGGCAMGAPSSRRSTAFFALVAAAAAVGLRRRRAPRKR